MKENERLLLFYEECVKKGYSDMTDPQQALKAKVIATDRKLRYGNSIEQFFQKAKAAYKEREAERIAEKQRIAEETRRCAVPGEELVKLHSAPEVISVFKRPDGSFYCTFDKNPERKIEGKPEFRVVPSSTVSYEYHPSETRITMASKGGFTGGQVWETDPWVSRKHEHTGMAFLEITVNEETVVLLSHKKPDGHINVKVEFGEGEGKVPLDNIAKRAEEYKPKERVTYKMIKEYIEAKYGFKVHTAYIAEVKRDLGLPMYDAPNAVEELKQPRKHPTAEKVEAIKDALKHFEVI